MGTPLRFEYPFAGDPKRLMQGIVAKARSVGANVEVDSSGLGGTFILKRLFMVLAEGSFALSAHTPGVARVELVQKPAFVSDAQLARELEKIFAELQQTGNS